MDAKGALPKLPGDQPSGEQIRYQCRPSEDHGTIFQIAAIFLDFFFQSFAGCTAEVGTEIEVNHGGSCGYWSLMSTE